MSFDLFCLFLGGQRVLQDTGQLERRVSSPEVREVEGGLSADHVIVQSEDINAVVARRL